MTLPFTVDQFIDVFVHYNQAIWPAQALAYALGFIAVFFTFRRIGYSDRANAYILALFWLWIGIVYHWLFFARINKAAYLFGLLSVVQGILFFRAGMKDRLSFSLKGLHESSEGSRCARRGGFYAVVGFTFIAYASVIYPLIGTLLGHGYPKSPCFGVAPCPVTIFTFGLLLLTDRKVPKHLLIIPLLWSLIGFNAALALGIREDIGLLVAGVLGTILILLRDRAAGRSAAGEGR